MERVTHPLIARGNINKIASNVIADFDESGGTNIFPRSIDRGARGMSRLQLCLGNGAELESGHVREDRADDDEREKASGDHHFCNRKCRARIAS